MIANLHPCLAAPALPAVAQSNSAFSFVALGDMPHAIPEDHIRSDRPIDSVGREKPAFSLHIGA